MQAFQVSNCKQSSSCEVREYQISLSIASFFHSSPWLDVFLQLFVDSMLCKTKTEIPTLATALEDYD